MLPYRGEKLRPEDPDYWTWKYAFWSMRHPGSAVLMFVWPLSMNFNLGSLVSLPVVLLVREWIGRGALRAAENVLFPPSLRIGRDGGISDVSGAVLMGHAPGRLAVPLMDALRRGLATSPHAKLILPPIRLGSQGGAFIFPAEASGHATASRATSAWQASTSPDIESKGGTLDDTASGFERFGYTGCAARPTLLAPCSSLAMRS
jgi:hypothetical protein